ncbi:LPS assembly lipoprotein LptE [Desulfolithobacter sp.]
MRLYKRGLFLTVLLLTLVFGGCGYYFPHIYDGPEKTVYMPQWKNRTNQLDLDTRIYHSLARWFQKSSSINLIRDKKGADLILAGEIVSIDLPSISWDGNAETKEVKVRMQVRYVLKDLKNGTLLWEVPREVWSEEYQLSDNTTSINEQEAVEQIIADLSERIYLGTLERLRQEQRRKESEKSPGRQQK